MQDNKNQTVYRTPDMDLSVIIEKLMKATALSTFLSVPDEEMTSKLKFQYDRMADTTLDFQMIWEREFIKSKDKNKVDDTLESKQRFNDNLIIKIDRIIEDSKTIAKEEDYDNKLMGAADRFKKWVSGMNLFLDTNSLLIKDVVNNPSYEHLILKILQELKIIDDNNNSKPDSPISALKGVITVLYSKHREIFKDLSEKKVTDAICNQTGAPSPYKTKFHTAAARAAADYVSIFFEKDPI